MSMEAYSMAYAILTAVFVGGIAWGASKSALNGTRTRVSEIQKELRQHIAEESGRDSEVRERIVRIETKVDVLIEKAKP